LQKNKTYIKKVYIANLG